MKSLILPVTLALLTSGCATVQAAGLRRAAPAAVDPCASELQALSVATWSGAAEEHVRTYLGCVQRAGIPPADLPGRVRAALDANPYPRALPNEVYQHFFDLELLKVVPGSAEELAAVVSLLEDQALARSAMGELDVADAALARARRLERLQAVLSQTLES